MAKKKLNKEQLEAIQHGEGPLLIIAGAGTGKTTVVTERVKWLVSSGKARPSEILALTFTEKAAREMEERVDVAMPMGYTQMWISTFHSFGDRILRQEALNIGLDPHFVLMTEADAHLFVKNHLFEFDLDYFRPHGNPTKFITGMLQHFSRLKDEDVSLQEYLAHAQRKEKEAKTKEEKEEAKKSLELAKSYKKYEELKVKNSLMDFSDLISNTLKLFRTRPSILKRYQKQFKYILVDEFQDTNIAQNELVILLAGKKANLTVVADDDQCLPPDTLIAVPNSTKKIEDIKVGDQVVTAVGKGYTSLSKVTHVFKRKKKARFLTFTTKSGGKITVTDNHKMFCFVPPSPSNKNHHFIYLMHQQNLGWRLGITNNLAARIRQERHADRIVGIASFKDEEEAKHFEALYSVKYGLPTTSFYIRPKQITKDEWLERLSREIDTDKNAQRLARGLNIDLSAHHFCVNGATRGVSKRTKINLMMCYRRRRVKSKHTKNGFLINPLVSHAVYLETSNPDVIERLRKAGYKLDKAKKGYRFRFVSQSLRKVGEEAERLQTITGGILDKKSVIGTTNIQHRPARLMPAKNVLVGNFLPVLKERRIVYEEVIERKETEKEETVYDLEVERSHNFVANGTVVHNSIYKWRGAAVSNVLQFKEHFPHAKLVVLTQNYRSTQTILDYAYKLIQNNNPDRLEVKEEIDKKLLAVKNPKDYKIRFFRLDRVENEAEAVAKEIRRLTIDKKRYDFKDVAILVRANAHAEPFTRALYRFGIPYQFLGPGMLLKQPEVKELIAYLKVLYNFEDDVAMYSVLAMDHFEISPRDLAAIVNFARKHNFSLFEATEEIIKEKLEVGSRIKISKDTVSKLAKIVSMIHRHLKLVSKETAGQILYYFLENTGLLRKLTEYKTTTEERRGLNVSRFFDKLKRYEVEHADASVYAVVDWLGLSLEMGESPLAAEIDWSEENAVNILTVHSAKGLEFPVVFLVNLVPQRFPTRERREQIPIPEELIKEILPEGDSHLQEERRLFYVGMTRAKDRLYLTCARYYGEGKLQRRVSPFVYEALGEAVETEEQKVEQLGLLEWQKKVAPKEEPLPIRKVDYLSYSQLEAFSRCPRQFHYRYVLRIPVPPSAAASFGSSIHAALRDFYTLVKEGGRPTEKHLLNLLETNWLDEGYASKAHERKSFKEARRALSKFYQQAYKPSQKPIALEEVFTLRVNPRLKIGGRIDRVDDLGDGKIEIIDYKTGKVASQREIDRNLQMTVYAMAATNSGIYKKNPQDVTLSFYFLESQEKISTKRTQSQLGEAKQKILEKAEEIRASKFEPKPGKYCDFCEYKLLCEAWR